MLVLTRKVGEQIQIGDNIIVTIVRKKNGLIRLGIEAPKNLEISRVSRVKKLDNEPNKGDDRV
jgi:carbon storage regulator